MNSLPIILRQGAAAAQRTAGKSKVADLLQQCTRNNHAYGLLSLRSISSTSASKDADDGRPGTSGTPDASDQGNSLPENATAAEMRQWADRMLGHKAEPKRGDEDPSSVSTLAALDEPLQPLEEPLQEAVGMISPEVSGADTPAVSVSLEEDSALPEDYALDLEEGDLLEAAAAVDVPMEGVSAGAELSTPVPQMESLKEDEEQQEEEDPSDAWARFVEQRFGEKVDLGASSARSSSAAAAEGTADSAVPSWRRFVMPGNTDDMKAEADAAAKRLAGETKSVDLPDFFNMKDPRRELERLLPETARRHDLAQSAFIQPMRDDADARAAATAAAPVSFKASAPLEPSIFEPAQPPPRRVTVIEPPMDRLANPVTGYANLGRPRSERLGWPRDDGGMGERGRFGNHQEAPRLHPTRMFYPGQTYDPEDLVDSGEQVGWRKHAVKVATDKATNGVVRQRADFRDQGFLNRFISELGKLPPKRTTRLQQKTHRHLCRQIKLARQMALLPIDSQLSAEYLERTGAVQSKNVTSGVEHNPHMQRAVYGTRLRA